MIDYQLSQVAIMHFEKGYSQQEIATLLGLSKMTVSRMLQKAKDQEIVKTTVQTPFDRDKKLEDKLVKEYGLNSVWVIKNDKSDKTSMRNTLARSAAFIISTDSLSNLTIGIGIGRTIGQFVKFLTPIKTNNTHIVQLMGGLATVINENPFSIIQETCKKLNATGTYIANYATAESKEARDSFFDNPETGRVVVDLWNKCDIAIFGIGTIENGILLSPSLVNSSELEYLKKMNSIGDVLGHCFTVDGKYVSSPLEDRLVSIPTKVLKKIPRRFAIVLGTYKVMAIKGAINAGLITDLITDNITAEQLV
ncbi:MAG: winged helix-turn-helix transcriptional regulator [Spirochaetales bacterium]|nr:winged helix-turn-helix transcriptional regulator [Spirochaetales bacterium]